MFAVLGICALGFFGFFFLLCLFAEGIGFELLGMVVAAVCICGVIAFLGSLLVGVVPLFAFVSEMLRQMPAGAKRKAAEIGAVVVSVLLGIICGSLWLPLIVMFAVCIVEICKSRKRK